MISFSASSFDPNAYELVSLTLAHGNIRSKIIVSCFHLDDVIYFSLAVSAVRKRDRRGGVLETEKIVFNYVEEGNKGVRGHRGSVLIAQYRHRI